MKKEEDVARAKEIFGDQVNITTEGQSSSGFDKCHKILLYREVEQLV